MLKSEFVLHKAFQETTRSGLREAFFSIFWRLSTYVVLPELNNFNILQAETKLINYIMRLLYCCAAITHSTNSTTNVLNIHLLYALPEEYSRADKPLFRDVYPVDVSVATFPEYVYVLAQ